MIKNSCIYNIVPYITCEILNNVVIMVIVCGRFVDTLQKKTGFFLLSKFLMGILLYTKFENKAE